MYEQIGGEVVSFYVQVGKARLQEVAGGGEQDHEAEDAARGEGIRCG